MRVAYQSISYATRTPVVQHDQSITVSNVVSSSKSGWDGSSTCCREKDLGVLFENDLKQGRRLWLAAAKASRNIGWVC